MFQLISPVPYRRLSGGLIASALVIGPLNFGSTRASGGWLLTSLVGAAAVCWAISLVLEKRIPETPLPVLAGLGALACSALVWLSGFTLPTSPLEFTRHHLARVVARWPHSVVDHEMGSTIAFHAALGLVLWMVVDFARDRSWMIAFTSVIVAVGVVVAGIALLQNLTQAAGIFWRSEGRMPGKFWGPFFHHTSAGAYLNTVWPLAAGLAVAFRSETKRASLFAFIATALLLGAHASHVSRFPQIAALLILAILATHLVSRGNFKLGRWALAVPLGIIAVAALGGRTGEIAERWHLLGTPTAKSMRPIPAETEWPRLVREDLLIPNVYNSRSWGDRGEAQQTALRAINARPLTGHGPGNWAAAASVFSSDPYVRSFYLYLQFTHEDFLQTWVEWGAAGFLSLILLLPGAVIAAYRAISIKDNLISTLTLCAALGLAAVLLQSLLDFPLQIPAIALNASVLTGLAWSSVRHSRSTPFSPAT